MKLTFDAGRAQTLLDNIFIEQYMPKANGEFVKVYLYLLRLAQSGQMVTTSALADLLGCTDNDVLRAIKYWESVGLLSCLRDKKGALSALTLCTCTAAKPQETAQAAPALSAEDLLGIAPDAPKRQGQRITADRKAQLRSQKDFQPLVFIGEQYFKRPLTRTEVDTLIYFYDTLHFSADLIEYLLEYCAGKGKTGVSYMETVAQSWYEKKITTPTQAREDSRLYNKDYYEIFRAMGISGRSPSSVELQYMDRWIEDYGLSMDMIKLACSKTVLKTGRGSFDYADGILHRWHDAGFKTPEEVNQKDQPPKPAPSAHAPTRSKPAANRFNNFEQREYDWTHLTEQLIGAGEGD